MLCGLGWRSRYSDCATGWTAPGIESLWRRDLSAPVQTGPGAHPASYTVGTGSLCPGEKAAGA